MQYSAKHAPTLLSILLDKLGQKGYNLPRFVSNHHRENHALS